jgi:hypothetical protein
MTRNYSDTASVIFMRMCVMFTVFAVDSAKLRHVTLITQRCHGSNINLPRLKVRIPYRSDKDNSLGNNKGAQFARGRK